LQALPHAHLAAGPDAAVAVLVAGEVLDDGLDHAAVRVGRILVGDVAAHREAAVRARRAVTHEAVEVRVGDIAPELADLHAARPGVLADLRALELAHGVLGNGEPEAGGVRARGHVA